MLPQDDNDASNKHTWRYLIILNLYKFVVDVEDIETHMPGFLKASICALF